MLTEAVAALVELSANKILPIDGVCIVLNPVPLVPDVPEVPADPEVPPVIEPVV